MFRSNVGKLLKKTTVKASADADRQDKTPIRDDEEPTTIQEFASHSLHELSNNLSRGVNYNHWCSVCSKPHSALPSNKAHASLVSFGADSTNLGAWRHSGFAQLSNELLLMILSDLELLALQQLALTCRCFYGFCLPLMFREVTLDPMSCRSDALLSRLELSDVWKPFIHSVNIKKILNNDKLALTFPSRIAMVLPKLTRLSSVRWVWMGGQYGGSIPVKLIRDFLQLRPDVTFCTDTAGGEFGDIDAASLFSSLSKDEIPAPIDLELTLSPNPEVKRPQVKHLFDAFRSNNKLRKVVVKQNSGGCVMYSMDPNQIRPRLKIPDRGRMSRLEEFIDHSRGDITAEDIEGWKTWARKGGFSKLKRLALQNSRSFRSFYELGNMSLLPLPELTSLTFFNLQTGQELIHFQPPHTHRLQELKIQGCNLQIPDIWLETCGARMKSFFMHERENLGTLRASNIGVDDIKRLTRMCPNIESLGIDMYRNGEWPYDLLENIAKMPKLKHLTLWTQAAYDYRSPVVIEPFVTRRSCCDLFQFIDKNKVGQQFEHLTLSRGGMGPYRGPLPGQGTIDAHSYQMTFACERGLDGDFTVCTFEGSAEIE